MVPFSHMYHPQPQSLHVNFLVYFALTKAVTVIQILKGNDNGNVNRNTRFVTHQEVTETEQNSRYSKQYGFMRIEKGSGS